MNTEIKTRWVQALRSGEYAQAQFALRSETGAMCCLGVLCTVVNPNGWNDDRFEGEAALPPDSVCKKAELGLRDHSGWFSEDSSVLRLAIMNDDEGKNFHQIADWIEANL